MLVHQNIVIFFTTVNSNWYNDVIDEIILSTKNILIMESIFCVFLNIYLENIWSVMIKYGLWLVQ